MFVSYLFNCSFPSHAGLVVLSTYSVSDELGSSARNSTLLDNDGTLTSVLGNDTSNSLESSHVSSAAGTNTTVLGGGVDGDEDNVGLADVLGNVGGEEQVGLALSNLGLAISAGLAGDGGSTATITGDTDDIVQAGLVDRRVLGVPAANASGVSVNDSDLDVGVLEGDDSGGGTT